MKILSSYYRRNLSKRQEYEKGFTRALWIFSLLLVGVLFIQSCDRAKTAKEDLSEEQYYSLDERAGLDDGLVNQSASAPAGKMRLEKKESEELPGEGAGENDRTTAKLSDAFVIKTATIRIITEELEKQSVQVKQLVTKSGGRISSESVMGGSGENLTTEFQIRVPAVAFESLISGLKGLGELDELNVTADDVGEEYNDLNIQLENRDQVRRRLLAILNTRAGSLKDILEIERELGEVTREMDRLKGRMRYLKDRVRYSTIDLTLVSPQSSFDTRSESAIHKIGQSFLDAGYLFVDTVAFLIHSLGVLIPLAVVIGIFFLAYTRLNILSRKKDSGSK